MSESVLDELIHRADLDELVRYIDRVCAAQEWAELLSVRDRSRSAVATGRQLWAAATLAEFRLARWAPPAWAARVINDDSGRFTIGPLTEVIAQSHSFASLAEHIDAPHLAGFVAHERARRGEAIPDDVLNPLDIPFADRQWEPRYPLADYGDDGLLEPAPDRPTAGWVAVRSATSEVVDDEPVERALRQLFDRWTAASTGRVDIVAVDGDTSAAITALAPRWARRVEISGSDALAWLGWAGATGAAHGRRRGAAIGRYDAWCLVAAMLGTEPDQLADAATDIGELRWFWWDAGDPPLGWQVHLAAELPSEGFAWAFAANDAR